MRFDRRTAACAFAVAVLFALPLLPAATAQVASVPTPNSHGDFTTALQPGNRGNIYQTRKWLVIDPDPTYLNCRATPNGTVRSRIAPGAVLTAVFPEGRDAIVIDHGVSWLRVRGTDPLMVGEQGTCYVRANVEYIAPINEDAIRGGAFED